MKKGFTLIELVAVIILLALLGFIIIPTVGGVISTNKEKLHAKQIDELKRHASTYATKNTSDLRKGYGSINYITVEDLYDAGIIQNESIIDPLTDEEIKGCLTLIWNDSRNQFDVEYTEECNRYGSLSGVIKGNEYRYTDITGTNPIEATVSLLQEDQIYYTTQSDASGNYSFNNVEVGTYILLVSQPYKTKQGEEVVIDGSVTKDMTVTLWYGDYNNDNILNRADGDLWYSGYCNYNTYNDVFTRDTCDINRDTNINDIDGIGLNNSRKITQITLSGTFNLSGKVISNDAMPTEILLMNNDNTYTATIKADGTYEFRNIPKGTYRLREYLSRYSLYDTYDIYLDDAYDVDVYIYHGDLDNSGTIDEGDIEALMEAIEKGYDGSSSKHKFYDINNDNVIDNADLELLKNTMVDYQLRYR